MRSSPASRQAVDDGIPVVLVGPPDLVHDADIPLIPASELIAMDEEPGAAVRTKKDSTLVRAAEAVRDGKASAMISAGNTGATMASALLRMGRIKGVKRPAIATPIPVTGLDPDGPARRRCERRGAARVARAVRPDGKCLRPAALPAGRAPVGLLSIGEEPGKGDSLRKEAFKLLVAGAAASTSSATSRVATS